jgi:hypothetical protein
MLGGEASETQSPTKASAAMANHRVEGAEALDGRIDGPDRQP